MENESIAGIILSSFFGLFSILFFLIKGRLKRGDILTQLFYIVLFGNLIWYSALGLEYINAYKPITFDSDDIFVPDVIFSTFLFKFRFLFLLFFFRLAFRVSGHSLPRTVVRTLKIFGIVIVLLWFVSWLEIPLRSSRNVLDRLMVYTDVLIFASVLITSIYIFIRAQFIIERKNKDIIRKLSYVFLIPALMGLFKWIVSDNLDIISGSFERMMIYTVIILFNSLIIWWAIKYTNSLAIPTGFLKQ